MGKLKKARTCAQCHAYNESTIWHGYCILGFDVVQLPKGEHHVSRESQGDYWTVLCKPAEPCLKPTTIRQYVAAFKERHPVTSK